MSQLLGDYSETELLLLRDSEASILTVGDAHGVPALVVLQAAEAPLLALTGPAGGHLDVGALQVVLHGADAAFPRPSGAKACYWIGTVIPENAAEGDLGHGWL